MNTSSVPQGPHNPRVYIIIVNFGPGWDTLECLESVARLDYPNFRIIVCDNGPGTGAAGLIRGWAAGTVAAPAPSRGPLGSVGPVPKPVSCACCPETELQRLARDHSARLVVIAAGKNRGFAAGANLGIAYAQACGDADYVWLLNNDTVVAPGALTALVRTAEPDSRMGLCGSTLLDYARPERIQACGGGWYDRWWGRTRLAGENEPVGAAVLAGAPLDFVHGASLLVRRRFLESVGPLDERYFLYFEDVDWARRADGRFRFAYAADSLVWHKDGGSVARPAARSSRADFYAIRNRIRFTQRFHPAALPTVYLGLLVAMLNRARRRQWDRVGMVLGLMLRPA